jgi:hypothetical protein
MTDRAQDSFSRAQNSEAFDKLSQHEEPEVQGHSINCPLSAPGSDAFSPLNEAEVKGHAMSDDSEETDATDESEPEVEGHQINPIMANQYANDRVNELRSEAARHRLSESARSKSRDGGMLDKILRRKE